MNVAVINPFGCSKGKKGQMGKLLMCTCRTENLKLPGLLRCGAATAASRNGEATDSDI